MNAKLTGIVQALNADPATYRAFGPFWWGIKQQLKAHFTPKQLYFLGSENDPRAQRRMQKLYPDPDVFLQAAIQHYSTKIQWGEPYDGHSYFPDTEDPYQLMDADFGPANRVM